MNNKKCFLSFTYHLIVSHFFTYFLIGIIFFFLGLNATGYYEKHPIDLVTALHRDSQSIWVIAGPIFQFIRALLFSIALFPIREKILEGKYGWLLLWLVIVVFAILAPAGEAPGSIEGIVYTNLPFLFHILYIPELLLQSLLFSWLFIMWERGKISKKITVPLVIISVLILLTIIIGLIQKIL